MLKNNCSFSELRRRWVLACRRKDVFNPSSGRVCCLHFLPSDFKRDLRNELLGLPTVKRLHEDAVPSQVSNEIFNIFYLFNPLVGVLVDTLVVLCLDQVVMPNDEWK